MPTLATNSVILDSVMNELRIPVSNLTERAKIQRVVSGVYGDMCAKRDWWWLQRRTIINTEPKIDTGTVAVTQNSTTVTFSTAPKRFSANVSVAGSLLTIPGNTPDSLAAYRITAHTSGATTATLDAGYTGTTATASSFTIYQVSYDLPADCAKLTHLKRFGFRMPLQRMGIEDLSYLQTNSVSVGKPQAYSIFDFATNGSVSTARELQIYPYPDQAYRLEVWYKHANANDTSTDLDLPLDYQQALIYGGIARGYPIFLNDLERGAFYQSLFNDVMALMVQQQREYASDKPGIAIDMRMYRNAPSRSRVGGRSLGPYFDILPYAP